MKSLNILSRNIFFTFIFIASAQYSAAQVQWPLDPVNAVHRIWEGYGQYAGTGAHFHEGLDLPVDSGTPVFAVTAGSILECLTDASHNRYHQLISISNSVADLTHAYGYVHIRFNEYKNNRARFWEFGDITAVGDTIGFVAKHPAIMSHLHFEKSNDGAGYSSTGAIEPDLDGNPIDFLTPNTESEKPTILTPVRYGLHGGTLYTQATASGDTVIRKNVDILASMYDRFSNFAGVTNYNIAVKKVELGVVAYKPGTISQITFPQNQIDFTGLFLSNDTPNTGRNTFNKFRIVNKVHAVYSSTGACTSVFQPLDGSLNDAVYWHFLTHIDTINTTFQQTDENYYWDTNGKEGDPWSDIRETVDHEADSNKTAAFPDGRYIVRIKAYGYGGAADTISLYDTIFVNNFNEFIYSCNSAGKDLDYFCIGDPVYIKGKGFPKNTTFKLHLTKDTTWTTGMAFNLPVRVATFTVTSDAAGQIPITSLMASYTPNDSPDKGYDIIIDYEGDSLFTSVTDTCTIDPQDTSIAGSKAFIGINPFQKTYGGPLNEIANSVYPTFDGGYIFTGVAASFGTTTPNDVYLVKTDINGDTLWTRTISGTAGDNAFYVQQTPDSGYIIAGFNTAMDDDVYLIRVSKTGGIPWTKNIGTPLKEKGFCVQATSDGGYIITGHARNGLGEDHAYLIKTDVGGEITWTKIHSTGPGRTDLAYAVQQTTDGGYMVAGYTFSPTIPANAFLLKTDAVGSKVWVKLYGAGGFDYSYSMQQTSDSGYIFAGSSNSFSGNGKFDVYVVRTDGSGTELWTKTYGGLQDDFGNSVRQTSDGGFIISGRALSFGAGASDVYAIKTDAAGIVVWSRAYGGILDDSGNSASQAKDGGYIIAGNTLSFGAGMSDAYLIKTDCIGSSGCNDAACATITTWCTSSIPPPPPTWTVDSGGTAVIPSPIIGMGGSTVTTVCNCIKPDQPGSITMTGGIAKVCPGEMRTYTVPPVIRANYYTWTLPVGAIITSGVGTNSVTITFINGFIAPGTLEVIAVNSCGSSPASTLIIEPNTPVQPGSITGPSIACAGTTQTYSVTSVPGITYNWIAPPKASISSGQGTNTVTVSFNTNFKNGLLTVSAENLCGISDVSSMSIIGVAAKPDSISGQSAGVCAGTTKTYSVPFVSGVTSWTWTPPLNGTITSGQFTNAVTIAYNINFSSGTLSVIATNTCGSSGARTLLIKSIPSNPSPIIGPAAEVCAGTTKTYSVTFVSGVTYAWNPPSGASIASGQGTNTVTVSFSGTFVSGAISVTAANACGISGAKILPIKSVPSTPAAISGPAVAVCKNTTQTYITPSVIGVTWTWTPPTNATIASGQGTNTVNVAFNNSFSSGILKVVAVNACGSSVLRSLSIKSKPIAPTAISGNASPCIGATETYSIAAVPGAVSYLWTKPTGSTIIAGQGTTSVNVTIGTVSGNITVKGVNVCGNGSPKSLPITVSNCNRVMNGEMKSSIIEILPNPADEKVNVKFFMNEKSDITISLTDALGKIVLKEIKTTEQGENSIELNVSTLSNGIYFVKVSGRQFSEMRKLIIQ